MKSSRVFTDLFGEDIDIHPRRWRHVCETHPELTGLAEEIGETLCEPDLIKLSTSDPQVRLYYKFFHRIMKGKYLIAVVKTTKPSFLVTAYVSDYIKGGEEVWRRKR